MDDGIYERNLAALEKSNPAVAEKLKEYKPDGTCRVETAKNGQPTMRVKIGEQWKYIHSKFNPEQEAEDWAAKLNLARDSHIVLYGFGLGYHAVAAAKRVKDENKVLVLEPFWEIFYTAMHTRVLAEIEDPKIALEVGDPADFLKLRVRSVFTWRNISSLLPARIPVYDQIDFERCVEFNKAFGEVVVALAVDVNTVMRFARQWTEQAVKGTQYFLDAVDATLFGGAFKGAPAVLVSAGPSLNKNVELLKRIKGKFPIVCVYTAFRSLHARGIVPDFLVSVDANQTQFEDDEARKLAADIPLVCLPDSDQRLLKAHTAPKLLVPAGNACKWTHAVYELAGKSMDSISVGGSVACMGADFLRYLGANPIILIGQDLAYTDNKTHAFFYGKPLEVEAGEESLISCESWDGGRVTTSSVMFSYKMWFDVFCEAYKNDLTVINATEGGVRINGAKPLTLKDAIDKYMGNGVDVEAVTSELLKRKLFSKGQQSEFLERLKEAYGKLGGLIDLADEAVERVETMTDIYEKGLAEEQGYVTESLKRLTEIDEELVADHWIYCLADTMNARAELDVMRLDGEKKLNENIYILTKNKISYNGWKQSLTTIKPLLGEAIEAIEREINREG